jgi:hypothetical protein
LSSIYDWSLIAANNANSDSLINWAEGMPPSAVNNSARQLEARVAEILADLGGALTAGGTANVLTVTANSAFTSYANGQMLALRIATDNSGAATLNVNGLGAKSIRKFVAAGETALTGAEMQATGIYVFRYSTALNAAAGGWVLESPTIDVPSFAPLASPALTGTPTAPTAAPGTNTTQISTTAFVSAAVTAAISALSAVYQPLSAVLTALAGLGTAVAGDIIYATGAGTWGRLAKGTSLQLLRMNAGATAPEWSAPLDYGAGNAALAVGAVGTYALLQKTVDNNQASPGATFAGTGLRYANTGNASMDSTVRPSGTWMLVGFINAGANVDQQTSVFLRVS